MICNRCGAQINSDDKFCRKCGAAITNTIGQTESETLWYFLVDADKIGPKKESRIRKLIQSGDITRTTLVWTEGLETWIPAGNSRLSNEFNNIVPSIPVNACSEKWMWALSIVPLTLSIVLTWICVAIGAGASSLLTLVVIGMNIVCATLDYYEVKKVDVGFNTWMRWFIILVPVYIFIREAKTNKNYIPGVIWCVLFAIDLLVSIASIYV